ncbi:MAG: hypothetical protein EOS25_13955 [Mesorhizobium sp.]|uniref:hypothetical protein n=1 Tax=Mesorhizobium sp. TaxID=1871066 RepID=UPI000FE7B5ED|nr:hypothetical protein [Mesorhizobium sp.]RWD51227.1 MAG: hypothetical protein EOS59_06470 [Mesorhizobium sp.]RWE60081.1 MAG: hypothetical protein EOS24_13315 [Mesorhizobium sp.]RWF11536.1 MAG: hypothetical protein EOS69_08835 [Mesorhizobium sp.]RWF18434.1 MAG: hypothetical protein EOS25_13955 [Mesorhizobium sp.]TIW46657.1 MAG: hypothetical protein E5V71_04495 [Mesorhizobium sp.]
MHISPGDPEAPESRDGKALLKLLILYDDDDMRPDELQQILADHGVKLSTIAISGIRTDFRHTLKLLRRHGIIGEIDRTKLPPIKRKPREPDRDVRFYYDE